MVTEFVIKKFVETVNLANYFCFPLVWDDNLRKLSFSPKHHANSAVLQILIYFNTVIVLGQAIKCKLKEEIANFNLSLVLAYSLVVISLATSIPTFQTRDLARLWNCGIKFGQSFVGKKEFGNFVIVVPRLTHRNPVLPFIYI